jgi:hypothetical protein
MLVTSEVARAAVDLFSEAAADGLQSAGGLRFVGAQRKHLPVF